MTIFVRERAPVEPPVDKRPPIIFVHGGFWPGTLAFDTSLPGYSMMEALARAGYTRAPSEGPLDFSRRAASALPARADAIDAIAHLYADLRYGATRKQSDAARLRSLVRAFSA